MLIRNEETGEVWWSANRMFVRGGHYQTWRVYRDGKFLRTEFIYEPDDPDEPTPLQMAA